MLSISAIETTRSPRLTFISVTPCVARPMREICSPWMRMTIPFEVIIMRLSSPVTIRAATSGPVLSVTFIAITPPPARPWRGYSSIAVRLPKPLAETKTRSRPGSTTSIPTTRSFGASLIAPTPAAWRPIGRTWSSLKRIDLPPAVTTMMSCLPLLMRTQASSSLSSIPSAISPLERTAANWLSGVRLIFPLRVASTR